MTDPQRPPTAKIPHGEGDVPDKVLEELLAAFASDERPDAAPIDLDDPSIDALLGLTPSGGGTAPHSDESDPADPADPADVVTGLTPVVDSDASKPTVDLAADLRTEPVPVVDGPASPAGAGGVPAPVRKPIQIGGDDDDLIDAVYLDEEGADRLRSDTSRATEASVERTTILIGDDEIEGSSGGIPIATGTAMDPRLRARRIAVKRAVGRRRLRWFVIGGVIVVLVAGVLALLGSSLFEVKNISPSGVSGNTEAAYQAAVDELLGRPVLLVDTNAIESQLEKNPWIREARVSTDFPDSASIEIVERAPLATYQGVDGRWRIIDVEGAVLTVIDGRPLEFMLITGPGAEAEAGGSAGDAFRHAAELVEALSPAVRSRTEQVVVSDTGELSLRFATTEVIFGAPENLLDKLTRLEAVLTRTDADALTLINVSTPEIGYK